MNPVTNDKRRDLDLGMDRAISRRDFLDGAGFDAARSARTFQVIAEKESGR